MQEPTEPSLTKPVAGEAQCDPTDRADSDSRHSAPESVVPGNFVEILQIPKAHSPDNEKEEEKEMEDETNEESNLPGEELMTGEGTPQGQPTKREPLPSEITLAAIRQLVLKGTPPGALMEKWQREQAAEQRAQKEALEREAEKLRLARENAADQEDEEEFAEEARSKIQPDQFVIKIGGRPANTSDLTEVDDLIRGGEAIEEVHYVGAQDGIINQSSERFVPPWDLRPLYESLILPAGVQGFRTTRELFDDISALLRKHVMLPSKDCSLLAYWAIATWFTDYLPFLPSVIVSGPASTADLLLRTLAAVCRRPVLLGELSPAILRRLPINEITPTLLIREPQLSRYTLGLLDTSNQPGYLFFSGKTFQELYCPKCIYVGELLKDSRATSNSVHINLGGNTLPQHHALPARDEITSFQNRLLSYRLLNHDKVAAVSVRVTGFRSEISLVAGALAAAIVDDPELQRGIIAVLNDRDEQSRVDRATGVNGLVLRAVLFHCHQKDERKFVREIAATANRFYKDDGESLKVSNETVGHALKSLGLYSHRLGNAGRGLIFDKATQAHAHRLSHAYDVLTSESSCEYCHELQQAQSEEVVQVE